ncbi:MAG: lysine exporter LysO family protein [Spirochaetaceae bacterium]|jgi:uncharacterized membrane protein YbjE (DUF340 family)|nr:lysine exporter LysO family protein [Spirochaetaceae bacterium]
MDTVVSLLILLACITAGYILETAGFIPLKKALDPLFSVVLYLLLFSMGLRLGQNREILLRLGEVGAMALLGAVFSILGTVILHIVAIPLYRKLDRDTLYTLSRPGSGGEVSQGGAFKKTGFANAGKMLFMIAGNMKKPALLFLIVIAGVVLGYLLPPVSILMDGSFSSVVLNLLLFIVGIQMKRGGVDMKKALLQPAAIVLPLVTIIGTLLGVQLTRLFIPALTLGKALALGGGFGWYSLSGVLISALGDPLLGTASFLANMFREVLALILISVLGFTGRCESGIGVAGATSMDVTLPLIENAYGSQAVPLAFIHGVILTAVVPFLIPLFMSMP